MYEKLSKQEFISKATKRIELRNRMTEFRETVFVEVLNKFNGKVYNKRFRTELSKMLPSDLWYISESYNPVDEIKIVGRIDRYNYSDTEDLHIKLVLNKEGRIMAKETLEQDFTVSWLQSFKNYTESIGDSIENYDRYFQMSKEIESMLQNYGDNVPFYFRDNITGFRSYILK